MKILECVPNFSEGRDPNVLGELEAAARRFPVKLLDLSRDPDHHRAVMTLLGEPAAVEEAALAVASRAVDLIDMRRHQGSHPRMGAVDVVPFVPLRGVGMDEAVAAARRFGKAFGEAKGVPVFFYEEAATLEVRRNLADVRRGEYEGLRRKLADTAWRVDAGPQEFNPRAGATAVGARIPLIAFNVNLDSDDLEVARKIARAVRAAGGGLPGVKAIGLRLEGRGIVQVSMNLVDSRKTPIHRAVEQVRAEAARHGVSVRECELVGLVPLEAIQEAIAASLQLPGFTARHILEYHLLPEG